jgi:hypothetical protein
LGCVSSRYSMIASDSNRIGPSPSVKAGARPSPRQGHTGRLPLVAGPLSSTPLPSGSCK